MSHVAPLRLGAVEISVVCQGWAPLALDDEAPGHTVDWPAERAAFPWAFDGDRHWQWHVQAFAVRTPHGLTMVDTGLGQVPPYAPWPPGEGRAADPAYAEAGVEPEAVTTVILTHLHPDHSGGIITPEGEPRFPNARHVLHPVDWAFLRRDDLDDYSVFARPGLDRVHASGMLDLDEPDREVVPGIRVAHTPGHTPGHRSAMVEAGEDTLLLTGDLLHLPIQFAHPDWGSSHDEDADLGVASRVEMVRRAADLGWTVGVPHFAEPFGTVTPSGWSSRWNG